MVMTSQEARVADPVLSEYARGYVPANYVGGAIFPMAPVRTDSGKVIEFGKEAFRRYNARRAPGAAAKEISFGYFGKGYQLVQDTLDGVVPREIAEAASQGPGIDIGMRTTRVVMGALTLAVEIEQAEIATNPASYSADHRSTLSGTDKWSNDASKPIPMVRDAIETVRRSVGIRPNVAIFSAPAFKAFEENPSVVDRFKLAAPVMTADILASILRLERVAIAEAVYADDDDAFVDVWGNHVVLAYAPQRASGAPTLPGGAGTGSIAAAAAVAQGSAPVGIEQPSFGYTYYLEGHPLVEQPYWDAKRRSWVYGVTHRRLPVLTGMSAGFLIQEPA